MTEGFSFHDLPEDHFPFTAFFFRDGEEIHRIVVTGPGAIVVPALGRVTMTRLEFANGFVSESVS